MSEIELKFEVTQAALRRLAAHPAFDAAADRVNLTSRYFDTPNSDLREAGLSLRVRRKGRGYVQTLKRSRDGDLFDRDEWEGPTPGQALDLSLLADTPVAGLLGDHAAELQPRFTSRIRRDIRLWKSGPSLVEVSIDRGEIVGEGCREPLLELELELKDGPVEGLYALAEDLSGAAPMRLSFDSKSERGYRLVAGQAGQARKAASPALSPKMTCSAAFARIAESCLMQLAGNAEALRRERRPESLHQTRIGLRRLRSAMSLFKPMVFDAEFDALRLECKWAAGELDLARNLDVFIAKVSAAKSTAPRFDVYLARLNDVRERAYDRAREVLDSPRFARLLLNGALWVENGPWTRTSDCAQAQAREGRQSDFAAAVLDDRRKSLRKAGKDLHGLAPDVRHRLRIKAKKLRYAAEFLDGAFEGGDKRRRRFIDALKGLQDTLGELNDIAVADESARHGVFGRGATELAFLAGQFVGALKANEPKLIDKAVKAYDGFRAAGPFWT
ncbi:inorganic triphosphatase [soil metagenome]